MSAFVVLFHAVLLFSLLQALLPVFVEHELGVSRVVVGYTDVRIEFVIVGCGVIASVESREG